jgi:hypothetical protein
MANDAAPGLRFIRAAVRDEFSEMENHNVKPV